MKRNREILIVSLVILIIAAFGGYYLIDFKEDQRRAYEQELLKEQGEIENNLKAVQQQFQAATAGQ